MGSGASCDPTRDCVEPHSDIGGSSAVAPRRIISTRYRSPRTCTHRGPSLSHLSVDLSRSTSIVPSLAPRWEPRHGLGTIGVRGAGGAAWDLTRR